MRLAIVLLMALLLALLPAAAQDKQDDKRQLPEGEGKATTMKLCNTCHGAQVVLGKPHSEEGWSAIVVDMVQRGAKGSDDELYEVIQYLTKNIKAPPKVNVNTADAKTIETGLEFTPAEAEAIVQAREKSSYKSIDDLKKVPGLSAAKIDARKSQLVF
jgi:competence protein ComEA